MSHSRLHRNTRGFKSGIIKMAKKATKRRKLKAWTSQDHRDLKAHSKAKSPVKKISKAMKRTIGAIRQKALKFGLPIGHRR
jgi:hypothetical protein